MSDEIRLQRIKERIERAKMNKNRLSTSRISDTNSFRDIATLSANDDIATLSASDDIENRSPGEEKVVDAIQMHDIPNNQCFANVRGPSNRFEYFILRIGNMCGINIVFQ